MLLSPEVSTLYNSVYFPRKVSKCCKYCGGNGGGRSGTLNGRTLVSYVRIREAWYSNHSGIRSNCAVISRIGRPVCSVSTTNYLRDCEIYERREIFVTRGGGLIC